MHKTANHGRTLRRRPIGSKAYPIHQNLLKGPLEQVFKERCGAPAFEAFDVNERSLGNIDVLNLQI